MVAFTAIGVGLGTGLLAGTALGTTLAAGGFAAFAVGFGANIVMGLALQALTPKPKVSGAQRGYQINSKGSALSHQIIYGKVRVGGGVVFDETTGNNNKFLHRIIAVAGHEIESFDEIYINDEVVALDGSGNVTSPSRYDGKVRINTHLGSPDQAADADLVAESSKWTAQHRLRGIAYIYVRLSFDADAFPNGVPTITATVKGKKVYNPDTDVTEWSDNPALCLRDYLTSNYGLAELPANIDDTLVNSAAVICDQTNTDAGTTRYTCNGAFTTDLTPYEVINNLLTSMGGTLWYAQGKWRMKPGYWTSPVLDLNEDDLRSSINVATRHSRRDNFNVVKGTFRGEESNWQTTDYPQVENAAFLATDNGQESVADVDLPFTDNSIEARRLARIALEANRQQLTVTASFGIKTMQVQVGDNVRLTNTRFGWTNKEFQVLAWNFGLTDGLDLQVELTLRETAESVFDEVDDGVVYERDNTNLLSVFEVPVPSLDAAVVTTTINTDGTAVPAIDFSWSVSSPELVEKYDFRWKLSSDTEYNSILLEEPKYRLAPALSGEAYDYTVRAVNHFGVHSVFVSSASPASTGNDGTVPNAPTNVVGEGGYSTAKITWNAPTQNTDGSAVKDLFQYRIYRGTSSDPTTLVGRVSGEVFTDGGLSDDTTYFYRVVAQDFSGNVSTYSANGSVTTSVAPAGDDGPRGAGRWNIGVTTLPTTSSGADTDFTNAIGDPVDLDQAWFYTGTQSNPTSQTVWIYDEFSDTWNLQEEVIDGDLVVDGTVTASKINVSELSAISADLGTILVDTGNIADLAVNTLKIGDNAVTVPISAYTAGTQSVSAGSWTTVQSVTLTNTLQPCQITASLVIDNTGTQISPQFRLYDVSSSSVIYGPVNAAQNFTTSQACGYTVGIQVLDTGQQVALQFFSASGSANYDISQRALTSLTVKK